MTTQQASNDSGNGMDFERVALDIDKPSQTALRRIAAELDLDKTLKWRNLEDAVPQFWALVERPPKRSVVIEIAPEVATWLLEHTNNKNRPLSRNVGSALGRVLADGDFEMTGDTVKVSVTGVMLDGQHRLDGSRRAKKPVITHVVFGLEPTIFDVLDQGKKRTPGDILAVSGIKDAAMVAAAVRMVLAYSSGSRAEFGQRMNLTARKIRELALGDMKDIADFATDGRLVHAAFKHPPSMITAILYMIGRQSKALAKEFAHEWVHGAKIGRNENFDVLNGRLLAIQKSNAGHVNRTMRAALIIQTFNHWHAGVVADPRALTWRREWTFPRLQFDKQTFLKAREQDRMGDLSLPGSIERMLLVLGRNTDADGNVEMPVPELAKKASIPDRQVNYVLDQMAEQDLIHRVRPHSPRGPAIWRLKEAGIEQLRTQAG